MYGQRRAARMEVQSKSAHWVQVSRLGEMWGGGEPVIRSSWNKIWGLSVGFCFLPSSVSWYYLRVCSADSGHALELSPPLLLTLSGLATEEKSFSPECLNPGGKDLLEEEVPGVLEGMGAGFVKGIQTLRIHVLYFPPPTTATCSHQPYSFCPPPPFLGCLQPYLETHGGLRWDGAISRKCSGIFIPGKKKKKRDLGMRSRIEGSGC